MGRNEMEDKEKGERVEGRTMVGGGGGREQLKRTGWPAGKEAGTQKGYGMVWYGMVWYGMVWYGMVWYGMVWYGMVCYATGRDGTMIQNR
jgi:hypothetical protein